MRVILIGITKRNILGTLGCTLSKKKRGSAKLCPWGLSLCFQELTVASGERERKEDTSFKLK